MIDLSKFIGNFEWKLLEYKDGNGLYVPDIEYICRFIILCIMVYFLIKGVFTIVALFRANKVNFK